MVFRLTRKVLCEEENFLNNTNFANGYSGCLVHSLVSFLMAIGMSRSCVN